MGTYNPKLPTKHVGTDKYITFFVSRNRSPTGADYRQPETGTLYSIGTVWQVSKNPTTGTEGDLWMLSKIVANVGYWVKIASGVIPSAGILTLSDTVGTLTYPTAAGNIQLYGTAGEIDVVSDPSNNRIIFSLPGGSGAIDSVQVQAVTAPGVNPVLPDVNGLITVNGAIVANHGVPLQSRTRALNTYNLEAQYSIANASTDATLAGMASFSSAQFGVDANGFVTLKGSGGGAPILGVVVDADTAPGTSPVVPNSSGNIIVTGGQVAAGTTTNVVQTNSLAANTYTVQIQRSQAVASSTVGANGVSHFNSSQFTVDGNGFVSLAGSVTPFVVNRQVFTTTGTYTPTSGMVYCDIEVVGGGGGGGGCAGTTGSDVANGGGGGGGGYAKLIASAATIGASKSVTVGGGGAGGTAGNNNGSTGGTSSVGLLVSATGGAGGTGSAAGSSTNAPGGAGGVGSGGDVNASGGPGWTSYAIGSIALNMSGFGGNSIWGGGAIAKYGLGGSSAGNPGNNYGGGGSGAYSFQNNTAKAGGNGAQGIVVITEYIT